jgi:hypothetical protein
MAIHQLSKSTFIRGQQCVKSLYLNKFHSKLRDRISPEQMAKFKRGTDVGVLARDLYPGGIDLSPKSPSQYPKKVLETALAMQNPDIQVIYEACFVYEEVLILLDILVRQENSWLACEVKSSLKLSETYRSDAALQYFVLKGAGVEMTDFQLIYLNKDYVFHHKLNLHELFISESVLEEVRLRESEIGHKIDTLKNVLKSDTIPDIPIGPQCENPYPCDFHDYCWKNIPDTSLFKLDAFPEDLLFSWFHSGITKVSDIPSDYIHSEEQNKQINSLIENKPSFDNKKITDYQNLFKGKKIAVLKTIIHCPAVPEVEGAKPYEKQVLAVHISGNDGSSNTWFFNLGNYPTDTLHQILNILHSFDYLILDQYEFIEIMQDSGIIVEPEKLLFIHEILNEIQYFHPVSGSNRNLSELHFRLFPTSLPLKNEIYLITDLLSEPKGNWSIENSLKYIGKSIHKLVELLIFEEVR